MTAIGWLAHQAWRYWLWAGSNVGAMPACGAVAGVAAWLSRHWIGRRLAAWWDRHHGPLAVERHMEALRRHEKGNGSRPES